MGLNVAKGNMYDFVTHTWNTVKGRCPHDCSYCYMKRWGDQKPVRFDKSELKTDLGSCNYIFVGSSCDMFAEGIPLDWILETIAKMNQHDNRYLLQSKMPSRMAMLQKQLDHTRTVVCTTIETNRHYRKIMRFAPIPLLRAEAMKSMERIEKYVTIEPIIDFDMEPMVELIKICDPIQVNIGADSGSNRLPEPPYEKVLELIDRLKQFTMVAKKRNLGRLERSNDDE